MSNPPIEVVRVKVLGRDVILDPANMKYDESSLARYMSEEYAWVDYFGKQFEYAQKEMLYAEIEAEAVYSKKFIESKDLGYSDNYAKAYALANQEYIEAKKKHIERKEVVGLIKSYLKAFDKNHENAQNRGHTIRKEMDKFNRDSFVENNNDTCCFEDSLDSFRK
jgi:hypothetical protein